MQERNRLEQQITSTKSQINSLPKGDFFCSRNGKYYKWYHTDGKHQTLIPKKQRTYAEQLVQRKYLLLKLDELKRKRDAINTHISTLDNIPNHAEQLFYKNEEYERLLSSMFAPDDQELLEWLQEPYEKNTKYPEQLIHKTLSGNYVRSKSEEIIDMALSVHKIPFRYECALQLGEIIVYPDFTIRHPKTGEIYYWEHLGLIDEPHYCNNALSKLQRYISYGLIPTHRLITTYETKECPLDSRFVMKTIETYFL